VILGPRPPEIEALINSRRSTGADLYDEVWEGDYHMNPALRRSHGRLDAEIAVLLHPLAKRAGLYPTGPFNLGSANDYRIPDGALCRDQRDEAFADTAALVVEVVSPGDESEAKLPFYAARGVDEAVLVVPTRREVRWLRLVDGEYRPTDRSELLGVAVADIPGAIDWPPTS
jgi:Uma2 family endonuclease